MNDPNAGSRPYIVCSPVAAGWPHNHHSAPGSSSSFIPDPFRALERVGIAALGYPCGTRSACSYYPPIWRRTLIRKGILRGRI